jgi:hypothetical protein
MKMFAVAAVLAVVIGATAGALAQDQSQSQDQHHGGQAFRQACGADMQTYCSAATTRDARHQCMQDNKDKFSDTCKALMANFAAHRGDHGGDQH